MAAVYVPVCLRADHAGAFGRGISSSTVLHGTCRAYARRVSKRLYGGWLSAVVSDQLSMQRLARTPEFALWQAVCARKMGDETAARRQYTVAVADMGKLDTFSSNTIIRRCAPISKRVATMEMRSMPVAASLTE